VVIRQRDGTLKAFEMMHVHVEMFAAKTDLLRNTARKSDVLEAVRNATPESRAEFEQKFGAIAFTQYIITPESRGGQVEAKILTEDGEVLRVLYEGDSEEARSVREGVQAGTTSETPNELPLPPIAGRWIDDPDEDLSE
jgi:hypothetical protein